MPAIRPVLLVGTRDASDLVTILRLHSIGAIVASSCEQAVQMLEQFRVDAIVCGLRRRESLRKLVRTCTPVVLLGADPLLAWDTGCAGFVSSELNPSMLPNVIYRVMQGERGIATQGVA
jgi:hypothetical protein